MLLIQVHVANMNTLLMMYYNISGSRAFGALFSNSKNSKSYSMFVHKSNLIHYTLATKGNFIFKDANLNRSLHSLSRRDIKTTKQADYFLRVTRFYDCA